jgi:hypothetical protein
MAHGSGHIGGDITPKAGWDDLIKGGVLAAHQSKPNPAEPDLATRGR